MKYQFIRLQDDGRLASITPTRMFETIEAAKAAAPDFLSTRKGGGTIVLVQILEVAILSANVRYEKFDVGLQKKMGLISSQRP